MNHSFLGFEMILGTQELRGLREREGDSDDDGQAHGHIVHTNTASQAPPLALECRANSSTPSEIEYGETAHE